MNRSSQIYQHGPSYGLVFPWDSELSPDMSDITLALKDGLKIEERELSEKPSSETLTPTFRPESSSEKGGREEVFHFHPNHHSWTYALSSWLLEIVCCVISILAMIGMHPSPRTNSSLTSIATVVVLRMYNGTTPTKIFNHLTINSLIEFLTSISKFSFMVPIVSGLGQLKWLWFKDSPHPLTDFQLHENAGTGGLGSLRFSMTARMLVKS